MSTSEPTHSPPLFESVVIRKLRESASESDGHFTTARLRDMVDEAANEIRVLYSAVEMLMQENNALRKENAALMTRAMPPSFPLEEVESSETEASRGSARMTPPPWVVKTLAEQASSARLRATEHAVVQAGAEVALLQIRCQQLQSCLQSSEEARRVLQRTIDEMSAGATERDAAVRQLAAQREALEVLVANWEASATAAQAQVNERHDVIHSLRSSLATEQEKSALFQEECDQLREQCKDMKRTAQLLQEAHEELRVLVREFRTLQALYDQARVRVVQLEMKRDDDAEHQERK